MCKISVVCWLRLYHVYFRHGISFYWLLLFLWHLSTIYLLIIMVPAHAVWLWTGHLWSLSCQACVSWMQAGASWASSTQQASCGFRLKRLFLTWISLAPYAACDLCGARNFMKTSEVYILVTSALLWENTMTKANLRKKAYFGLWFQRNKGHHGKHGESMLARTESWKLTSSIWKLEARRKKKNQRWKACP